MNRPAPRKSSLAGSSPITPPPAAAPAAVDVTGWTQEQHEDADQVEQTRRLQEAERAAAKPAPREPKSRARCPSTKTRRTPIGCAARSSTR